MNLTKTNHAGGGIWGRRKAEVNGVCSETADLPNLNKHDQNAANHETDFDPPIYNVWKRATAGK
jgi:hypothetical protein